MCEATFKLSNGAPTPASEPRLYGHEFIRTVQRLAGQVFTALLDWQERARQRQHLAQLDDRMLKDIGLTRLDVVRETSKAFWEK